MNPLPVQPEVFTHSVVALPPLARAQDLALSPEQNHRLIRSIEAGGIRVLLYGSNAVLQHLRPSEYAPLLAMLEQIAGPDTVVIPSIGPSHGLMMEQLEVLRGTSFPTVQILPPADAVTAALGHGLQAIFGCAALAVLAALAACRWLPARKAAVRDGQAAPAAQSAAIGHGRGGAGWVSGAAQRASSGRGAAKSAVSSA
jgi:hypothetical protein